MPLPIAAAGFWLHSRHPYRAVFATSPCSTMLRGFLGMNVSGLSKIFTVSRLIRTPRCLAVSRNRLGKFYASCNTVFAAAFLSFALAASSASSALAGSLTYSLNAKRSFGFSESRISCRPSMLSLPISRMHGV